jgi:LPS-assembly protein
MVRFNLILLTLAAVDWFVAPAVATAQADLSGCKKFYLAQSLTLTVVDEQIDGKIERHSTLEGTPDHPVQIDCDEMQFFADHLENYRASGRVTARGNVLFVSPGNRISAERMEFNTHTRTGTFYVAFGMVTLRDAPNPSLFGSQEPEAYFWGEELHKLGPKKYRLKHGAFTTCVQPTPRWHLVAGTVTLNLDDYAILKNAVLSVKGVPLFYLPIMYYPIQDEDRATGFLMPIYGNSTYRGHTISNQFFWALGRSQDATLVHDWFSRTGQGYGGEYRYIRSATADGNAQAYLTKEHSFELGGNTVEPRESVKLRGSMREQLPGRIRASAYVDYFSDVTLQQVYNQNIFDASQRSRRWGGSASTQFGGFSLSGNYSNDEYFYGETSSITNGVRPSIQFSRPSTQLWRAPVYVNGSANFTNALRSTLNGTRRTDITMQKWDGGASVRIPFSQLRFLTINTNLGWHATSYSKSNDPRTGALIPVSVFRQYFDWRSEFTGPVLVRVWDRPGSSYAARIKHVFEPSVEFRRTTSVDNVAQIVKLDRDDYKIGGSLETRYGLTNRLLVKGGDKSATSREIVTMSLQQTHYGDPLLSQFDGSYSTSFLGRPPSNFSPVSFTTRFTPVAASSVDLRMEYDPEISAFQSISIGGSVNASRLQAAGTFSRRKLTLAADVFRSDDFVAGTATYRMASQRLGGTYGFNYDIGRSTWIQQRVLVSYNAQCCGIAVEYQRYNYPSFSRFIIPQDQRFNISFTLAGIGTFSNFLGALTGQPTQR